MNLLLRTAIVAIGVAVPALAAAADDWMARVGEALGRPGAEMPGGVYRVGFPRSDLAVRLDGVEIAPALALGSWLAFKTMGTQAMVMGDLVLAADEVNPVLSKLAGGGIDVTAIHNHLLRGEPATYYVHVRGRGDPAKLATALREALAESRTPIVAPDAPAPAAATLDLDTGGIDRALGRKGRSGGGVYQVSIARGEAVTDGGMDVPAAMGAAIAINFQPLGGGRAAIAGDLVLIASEVNPVLRELRARGIEVTALHNHMLDDQPRLFFAHFWAQDDAVKLAQGLAAALSRVNVAKD